MHLTSLEFDCRFQRDALLPSFKGSLLRGALGRALRAGCADCARDSGQAPTPPCPHEPGCLYSRLFEPPPLQDPMARRNAAVRPFALRPPGDPREVWKAGERFTFGLQLFGDSWDAAFDLAEAVETMGRWGLGQRLQGVRAGFTLLEVRCEGRPMTRTQGAAGDRVRPRPWTLQAPRSENSPQRVRLELVTPLRVKRRGRLASELPFQELTRMALRRISSLCTAFDGAEPDLDYRGLIARAEEVRSVDESLRWREQPRYSGRQQRETSFGGLEGWVLYEGPLAKYLPLLRFVEETHLGKQTTFGLGQVRFLEL